MTRRLARLRHQSQVEQAQAPFGKHLRQRDDLAVGLARGLDLRLGRLACRELVLELPQPGECVMSLGLGDFADHLAERSAPV
jgi:hypothetical protein